MSNSITGVSVPCLQSQDENYKTQETVSRKRKDTGDSTSSLAKPSGDQNNTQSTLRLFKLGRGQRLLAGGGHILNDLCASLWFTYLLLFMQKVVTFDDKYAAGLLFMGQVVDGIATPLVGYGTDRISNLWPCSKQFGRCKSWHLVGIILVAISFPFIFSPCVGYSLNTSEWSAVADWKKAIYYAPFIAVFQIGWACTQISHLALIPKLTSDDLIRTEILAIRYAFTVAANISVFIVTWLFLTNMGSHAERDVGTEDSSNFSFIAIISVALGLVFSVLFHIFVVEKSDDVTRSVALSEVPDADMISRLQSPCNESDTIEGAEMLLGEEKHEGKQNTTIIYKRASVQKSKSTRTLSRFPTKLLNPRKKNMGVADWLKLPQFYIVSCLYLSTRLSVNLSLSYMPLLVQTSLGLGCGAVAAVPLVMYCSGFAVSIVIKLLNKYLGRQLAYAFGVLLIVSGSGMILFLDLNDGGESGWMRGIYIVAVFIGGGSSAILVTSLSITADLIGNNIESGAFVYGAMSFCDKISCGLAVVLISNLNPCTEERQHLCSGTASKDFYTKAVGYSSGGSAISGLIFTLILTLLIMRKSKGLPRTKDEVLPNRG